MSFSRKDVAVVEIERLFLYNNHWREGSRILILIIISLSLVRTSLFLLRYIE
jgi:hypothetical protein